MEMKRHLKRNLAPLYRLHVRAIDRRRIANELNRIADECGPVQSNRTGSSLSAFYNWAIRAGIVENNPASHRNDNEEHARERVLSDAEIRTLWRGLGTDDFGVIAKLLLLTGQRRDEIGSLRRLEIDLEKSEIRLPPSRTKNKRPHTVPLSKPALEIIQARPQTGEYIFGLKHGFRGWSASRKRVDSLLTEHWTLHDLRRTAATKLGELGVQPHIIECILNHANGFRAGTAGIYNRNSYLPEMRQALDVWAKHVMELVS
jgi:integrase